jgi:carbonic anhydrase/acetyltransferase-like protein (isoleucine patch superfamily)
MPAYQLDDLTPQIDPSAYIAPGAQVIGQVRLLANASVWFNAALRGDNEPIELGEGSNIQECAVLHTDRTHPLIIGPGVTVGHQAMLHGCEIGADTLIGMQAIILNGAKIGRNCIIGAGALVTSGTVIPDNSMVIGSPGKVVRSLKPEELQMIKRAADGYVERARHYKASLKPLPISG